MAGHITRRFGLGANSTQNSSLGPTLRQPGNRIPPFDVQAGAVDYDRAAERTISLRQSVERVEKRNIVPRVRQTPYFQYIVAVNSPQLLIPQNIRRVSFLISAPIGSTAIQWTYGYPTFGTLGIGISLPPGANFQETSGIVSTDDIYIFSSNAADLNKYVTGFEGILAVESPSP